MQAEPCSQFGPFEFDPGAFKLRKDGAPVAIEPKALTLLALLIERAPRVVDKAEIFSIVWKDVNVTDNALTRAVAQLRKVLNDDPKDPQFIETVATRGYRFAAVVTRVPPGPAATVEQLDSLSPAANSAVAHRSRWRALSLELSVAVVALVAATAWFTTWVVRSAPEREAWMTEEGVPDIAKLAALQPEQLTSGQSYDGFLAYAPDGKSIAFSSDRSGALEVYVQSVAAGSTPTALTSNGKQNVQPVWSPDGQFIAYHAMADGGIWIVPSRGGVPRKVSDVGARPAWSPDGRRLAFQSLPVTFIDGIGVPGALSTIGICNVMDGSEPIAVTRAGEPAGPHLTPTWLPDAKHLLFSATSGQSDGGGTSLWNIDVDTRQLQQVVAHQRLTPEYVLAGNGNAIYFVARDGETIWWMPLGQGGTWKGDPQPTGLPVHGLTLSHLAISHDGRWIGWTGLERSNYVAATTKGESSDATPTGAVPLVRNLGVWYGLPTPASDGRLAMVGDRPGADVAVFLITPTTPLRQLTLGPKGHGGPQWMPGEREIAAITEQADGPGYTAIDPETGRSRPLFRLADLPNPPGPSQSSTASPATNIAFARDFTKLAMAIVRDGRPNVWIAGLQHEHPDGTLVQRTFEHDGGSYPVWSPDARWIAYQCNEGADTHVCVTNANSGERVRLTHESGQSWVGGWAPDNDTILFAAQRDAVWNVASVSRSTSVTRTLTRYTQPYGYVRYPRWDPLNHRLLFERSETTGRLWSVELPRRGDR